MAQVMIIDMLVGFTQEGPLASPRVDAIVPEQAEFLGNLPPGSFALFLADEHRPDDPELRRFPPHCMAGTREAEIRSELLDAARAADARIEIVRKNNFSGFYATDLDRIVAAAPQRHWIVIGCVTDCCIEANVAELVYRGLDVTVVRELVETWDMTRAQAEQAGLAPAHEHRAEALNDEWFNRRLPAIWGAKVVGRWRELEL